LPVRLRTSDNPHCRSQNDDIRFQDESSEGDDRIFRASAAPPVRPAGELAHLDRANAFDVFAAADRAHGPDAWKGYFGTEQTLTQRIQDVVRSH
jgi:hypothetical protein